MREVLKGSTDQSVRIRIVDAVDGTPETGVVAATSGLALFYRRGEGAEVALTESDLAAVDSAHTDGGIKHVRAGYYRVDLPDAAVATGADYVEVYGEVTGMVVIGCHVPLVDFTMAGQSAIDLKDFADAGYDPATNKVEGVKLADTLTTYTGNTPQTGDNFPRLGAPAGASIAADIATRASQTSVTTIDDLLDSEIAAIQSAIAALNNISEAGVLNQVNAALEAAVPDSIPADGSRPSIKQGIYMNTQFLVERKVSGTTMSIYKPDGVTVLFTILLNDAVGPSELSRAS